MPLFFLMGGEIVVAIVGSRIALWVWRGWRLARDVANTPQPPPTERLQLALVEAGAVGEAASSDADEEEEAAALAA